MGRRPVFTRLRPVLTGRRQVKIHSFNQKKSAAQLGAILRILLNLFPGKEILSSIVRDTQFIVFVPFKRPIITVVKGKAIGKTKPLL